MKRLVFIDTETGGHDASKHSILSLGAVVWSEGHLSPPFHVFIREPIMTTTPEAMKINRITTEEMTGASDPHAAVLAFERWLRESEAPGKQTLGGHNIAGFDMGFVKRLYVLAGKRMPFDYHVQDTMSLALALQFAGRLNVPSVKLDVLCEHFGIKIRSGERHNAAEDAVATAHLFTALLRMIQAATSPLLPGVPGTPVAD